MSFGEIEESLPPKSRFKQRTDARRFFLLRIYAARRQQHRPLGAECCVSRGQSGVRTHGQSVLTRLRRSRQRQQGRRESAPDLPACASSRADSPRARRFAQRIFRNPVSKARAYFLPYKPDRGSACNLSRECIASSLNLSRGCRELHSSAPNAAKCRQNAAAAHCRSEAETARRGIRRRKAKHSKPYAQRCKAAPQARLHRAWPASRKILPHRRSALHPEKPGEARRHRPQVSASTGSRPS